ncbi:VapE domain-containing protein [Burkholderia multivorans]|uniref:VapE domain-containing protein n=1 Tax=Burkholderia multivorans TaxID=87883 RepID=UPI0021C05691|nr:VapE domain-containing protein [Burkholderia multivorans]
MSNTPNHQDPLSSKYSMPNEYVDEKSATENSVTDQHVSSTTPDATNPVAAIGEAVGYRRSSADELSELEKAFDGLDKKAAKVIAEGEARRKQAEADRKARMAAIREETRIEWGEVSEGDESREAKKVIAESEERQKKAEADREARMADARAATRIEWFEVSEGFEHGNKAVAEAEARQLAADGERQQRMAGARRTVDIVERARRLAPEIQFKDVKKVRSGDMYIPQAQMTDENKLCVLNALFSDEQERPHRDHYRGRIVDHEGNIIDDHYPVVRWVQAFSAAGLKGVSLRAAREAVKEYALCHERNDLIDRVNRHIPQWDGQSRMKRKLIDLFELRDTPLTQNVGQYFWLSLYNRVMVPGSLAPIAIALIGAQGCGKSLFAKKLCQIITGDDEADSVQLNLDGDWMEFLRAITGNSVIATVGEMAGFTRADTNKIKDVTTRVADQMHYKFEGTFTQQRQWIMMLDGNKYELQRDETGNRRFMPLFCGQLEDVGGQPRWRHDFEAIFDDKERGICFEDDVWQIMAECAEWMNDNGESGYGAFVREVVRQVLEFNKGEMAAERGIVVDGDIETYLDLALSKVKLETVQMRDGSGSTCVRVDRVELLDVIHGLSNGKAKIHPNGLRKAMAARGADEVKPSGIPKYRFAKLADQAAFDKRLAERNPSMDDETTKVQGDRF